MKHITISGDHATNLIFHYSDDNIPNRPSYAEPIEEGVQISFLIEENLNESMLHKLILSYSSENNWNWLQFNKNTWFLHTENFLSFLSTVGISDENIQEIHDLKWFSGKISLYNSFSFSRRGNSIADFTVYEQDILEKEAE